jgi:hypothetical protein
MQMMHNAFFQHVSRPGFLIGQVAKTLRSSYRMNVVVNNLGRLGEIFDAANSVA